MCCIAAALIYDVRLVDFMPDSCRNPSCTVLAQARCAECVNRQCRSHCDRQVGSNFALALALDGRSFRIAYYVVK